MSLAQAFRTSGHTESAAAMQATRILLVSGKEFLRLQRLTLCHTGAYRPRTVSGTVPARVSAVLDRTAPRASTAGVRGEGR